jgi:hypothetical protein
MSSSSDPRSPVELLADEFLVRCKRGEKPTIKEYCDRHPDLANEIRDVFEALLMVEDLRPGTDEVSGSAGESVQLGGKRLQQVGDYRILCEIGRGGMGVVYEAEQQALGRRVALKVLPTTSAGDSSAQLRFQREAKAAARMHHTNIVPVFDVGQDGEHLYYAMQLIHGQGLGLVIDDLKRLRAQSTATPGAAADRAAERSIAASLAAGKFERENLAAEGETDSQATAASKQRSRTGGTCPGRAWQREPRQGGIPDRLDRGRAAGCERGTGFPPGGARPPEDARRVASVLWPDADESRRDRRPEPPDRPAVRRGRPRRQAGRAAAVGRPGSGQRPRRSYPRHP